MLVADTLVSQLRMCLGPDVAVAAADSTAPSTGLIGMEEELVEDPHGPRGRQFSAGRRAARTALQSLGVDRPEILIGERGQPLWPMGFAGSITHTDRYALSAAAQQTRAIRSIGIDCEPLGSEPAALHRALSQRELESVTKLDDAEVAATRWLAAKEAFFKAQYPITSQFLAFRDVEITPAGSKLLMLRVLVDTPLPAEHTLHSTVVEDHVLAAILIPEDPEE